MASRFADIEARVNVLARRLALGGLVGLVAIALMTIADVLGRWLFASPIDGVADASKLFVAVVVAAFFPGALVERHHISIRFLGNVLGARANAWLDAFASLVTAAFFTALAWEFVLYTHDLYDSGETTWLLGWPVAPWWTVTAAFMVLCIPVQVLVSIADLRIAARGPEPGQMSR